MVLVTMVLQMSNQKTDLLISLFHSISHSLDTSKSALLSAILDPQAVLPVPCEKDYLLIIGPVRQNNAVRTISCYVRHCMTIKNLRKINAAQIIQRRLRKICCSKIFQTCCKTVAACVIQQQFRRSKILDRCQKVIASYVITRCVEEVGCVKQIHRYGLLFEVSFNAVYDGFRKLGLEYEGGDFSL